MFMHFAYVLIGTISLWKGESVAFVILSLLAGFLIVSVIVVIKSLVRYKRKKPQLRNYKKFSDYIKNSSELLQILIKKMRNFFMKKIIWLLIIISVLIFALGIAGVSFFPDHFNFIINVCVNLLISFWMTCFGYFLFVHIPEKEKERKIKTCFKGRFLEFKKGIIQIFLQASNIKISYEKEKKLLNIKEFRVFFDNSNWNAVFNGLQDKERSIDEIAFLLECFERDLKYLLYNAELKDEEVFSLMQNLLKVIFNYRRRGVDLKYDDLKFLMSFLYGLFSGYDSISGYCEKDIIEETINKI